MNHRTQRIRAAAAVLLALAGSSAIGAAEGPGREEVIAAMRKAVGFYRDQVGTEGAYHFAYTEDLSYGRSESAEGRMRVEVQREGTPIVALAFLSAWDATHDRYFLEAARQTAYALVKGQFCTGGWDYAIEFDPGRRKDFPYRADGNCADSGDAALDQRRRRHVTNLDDNVTQAAIRVLMRVDRELEFKDPKVHEAALYAVDSLMKAQYPNGAWPQRYNRFPDAKEFPVKRASYPESWPRKWPGPHYESHYTFNDNSIVDMIDTMLEAARIYKEPRYLASAEKGGGFILLAQMPDPQPGWAQQYDRDMHPAWARVFEPPSVTGGESQGVMKMLLVLYRETGKKKYLEPVRRALDYYKRSALPPENPPSEIRARACPPGTLYCMARFYELETNRPLYITKGTRIGVKGQSTTLLDGYELSYQDDSVITHYSVLVRGDEFARIADEYESLLKADPAALRRPEKLTGLSPWSGGGRPIGAGETTRRRRGAPVTAGDLGARVKELLASMDRRGAWVEDGVIGRADRVISVFAAKDMVLTIGRQSYPVKENDTLDLYQGGKPPLERIIRSATFARNLETMAAFVAGGH